MPANRPSSVLMPVAVITTSARPRVTMVFMKNRLARSASGTSSPASESTCLPTVRDSPVSADSSTSKLCAAITRPSAGTLSPEPSNTISPGTSRSADSVTVLPSRRTSAVGASIFFSAASDCSARCSWEKPKNALMKTTIRMTTASVRSPMIAASTAAPISTRIRIPLN